MNSETDQEVQFLGVENKNEERFVSFIRLMSVYKSKYNYVSYPIFS